MIYSLRGTLAESFPGFAVIECGGVGYALRMPQNAAGALPGVGGQATVYTHLNVAENDVSLFGFLTAGERDLFLMLTGVSGVGPKAGLAILSALPPERIVLAVSAGDHKAFTAAQGVGPKLAQRIVLELRDKVAGGLAAGGLPDSGFAAAPAGTAQQAAAALAALGYTHGEAAAALAGIDPSLPVSEAVRAALQEMGRRKR